MFIVHQCISIKCCLWFRPLTRPPVYFVERTACCTDVSHDFDVFILNGRGHYNYEIFQLSQSV
ncbi:hypothetical protein DSUL_90094 [Desulfovibrionales bacterium]